jgi:hypothetical protein
MRILNIPAQPNAICEESTGYFFLPAIRHLRNLHLLERPYTTWTEAERTELRILFQECFDKLQSHLGKAQAAGKIAVVKEHCPFMTEPVAFMKFTSSLEEAGSITDKPWKVQLPRDLYLSLEKEDEAEEGKGDISAGVVSNDTVLPDVFLLAWQPTFLIRHPVVVIPSYYRVFNTFRNGDPGEMGKVRGQLDRTMTLTWTRRLYDWYMSKWNQRHRQDGGCGESRARPIILDADDIIASPETVRKYCRLVGLDETKLQFEWEPLSEEGLEKVAQTQPSQLRMRDTLFASTGIRVDKVAGSLDLETEVAKWKEEFGEEEGLLLKTWVLEAMPDYLYLRSKRLVM